MRGAQLVQLDAGGERAAGRLGRGGAGDGERAVVLGRHRGARGAQHVGEAGDLGAADQHRAGAVGARAELLHGALADQPAGADDDHPVDGLLDLGQQVAGDEDGAALLVGEVAEEAAQPLDALGVQAVGRLVEHQDGGVAEQRGGQRQPLPHAEGVAAGPAVAGVGQAHLDEHLVGARTAGGRRPGSRRAGGCGRSAPGGTPSRAPRRRCAAGSGSAAYGVPSNVAVPASGCISPRSIRSVVVLPAPFGPEEAGDRAGLHGEAEVADRLDAPEGLAQSADLDPDGVGRAGGPDGNGALLVARVRPHPIAPGCRTGTSTSPRRAESGCARRR